MENVIAILTSKDKEEVVNRIKDVIVEQVRKDFDIYDYYLFDPESVEDMVNDAFEEIIDELRPDFKKAIKKRMTALISELKIDQIEKELP